MLGTIFCVATSAGVFDIEATRGKLILEWRNLKRERETLKTWHKSLRPPFARHFLPIQKILVNISSEL